MEDQLRLLQWPLDGKALARKRIALRRALLERPGLLEKRIAVLGGSTTHDLVAFLSCRHSSATFLQECRSRLPHTSSVYATCTSNTSSRRLN